MALLLSVAFLPLLPVTAAPAPAQENPPAATTAPDESDTASRAFFAGDYATAKRLWEKLAQDNDPAAITNLGIMYEKGIGVKQDVKNAEALYLRAANLGYAQGQFDLANLYYNGNGIKQDFKQAGRWYMAAAMSGHLRSQYYLAQMYENGEGVTEDRLNALKWYVKAADGGLPEAKYVVGRKLLTGEDIKEDHPKAIPYLLDAADAGVPHARAWLGLAYLNGWGTPKNLVEAYIWLELGLDRLPAGELQQKAYEGVRQAESDMSQDQLAAAKRLLAKAEAKQSAQ
ncbi:MAG TPA: tetratricopeptide repeat protein [Dongiaceae bacterium]|nr:tetratricopeptide repeat protein [Dongiaceae bacterium]